MTSRRNGVWRSADHLSNILACGSDSDEPGRPHPGDVGTTGELNNFPALPMGASTRLLGSMHPCLSVDEILRLIACELVTSTEWKAALALACCCKSFEDPVLDALWEPQDRIFPLLESLPGDVWNECGYTVSAPITLFFLSFPSTTWIESPSKDSQRRPNGPVSGSTLEGCECSEKLPIETSCLRKFSRFCGLPPPTNRCFRI